MDESSYCHQNDILFRTDQNDQKKESSLKGEEIKLSNSKLLKFANHEFLSFSAMLIKIQGRAL